MDKVALKKKVCSAIDDRAEEIRRIKLDIWANPELGYKEHRTAERVAEAFQRIGLPYSTGHALTGVGAELEGTRRQPPVQSSHTGETDAVLCWDHENSDRRPALFTLRTRCPGSRYAWGGIGLATQARQTTGRQRRLFRRACRKFVEPNTVRPAGTGRDRASAESRSSSASGFR